MSNRRRRGRGEGSIFPIGNRWAADVSFGFNAEGKRQRRRIYGDTKQAVATKLRELQTAADRGQLPDAGSLTVGQHLSAWLSVVKASIAPNTYVDYEKNVSKLAAHLGNVKLAKLTGLHVQKLYADLERDGASRATQRRAGVTLGIALQHACRLRLVPYNVARDIPKPRVPRKEIKPLGPDEANRFLTAAKSDRLFALYAAWIDSGAREGELFGLCWSAVDFDGGAITITKNLEEIKGCFELRDVKTAKSRRRVPLSTFTMQALQEHRKAMLAEGHYRHDGPVFCDTAGGWLRKSNVLRRSFRSILKRAELPTTIRPYDLRHTGATLLLLAGEDAKVVAERLGHSTTRLTQDVYQHVLPGMQERAAAKLDAIFRLPAPPKQASG
jgi:integrase